MLKSYKIAVYWFLAAYLLLWVVLFEFILPVNKILPSPSAVIDAFPSLISDYQLFPNYISSVAVVYLSLICAYFAIYASVRIQGKANRIFTSFIFSLEWFGEYIPGIVLGLMLIFWFPASEYIEFIFAFLYAFIPMMITLQKSVNKVPEEYEISSKSLGLSERYINKSVIWKYSQEGIFRSMKKNHFNLWLVLIAFEYIKGGYGIGNIFHRALVYNDLSAFVSSLLITGISVYLGTSALKYTTEKTIFWK